MNPATDKTSEPLDPNGKKGRVYLVGAGPGDPGLITCRGAQLVAQADVVVYDYLVSDRLVQLARDDAEMIYVGKKAGQHTLPQEKINELLIEKAQPGAMVVRLKGGDPFIFGRGGEEALALRQAGLGFEVVPGITAAVAAAAYAGIPVTHRDFASEFALMTGHEDAERTGESQIDWQVLGSWRGTLAFYMGVRNLPIICRKLQEHGMAGDTPAALIRYGTTPEQRTLTATIATIAELAAQQKFTPPAVAIIGRVVSLRDDLDWFERRPLFGQRIVVTRSRAQASELVDKVIELGGQALEFPTIRIEPAPDREPLRQAIGRLDEYDWIIFTSVNGVEFFFEELHAARCDGRRLAGSKVCAIGPATSQRLREFGIIADLIPPRFVAEAIIKSLGEIDNLDGKRVLLPRADIARADLPEALAEMGAAVEEIDVYRTVVEEGPKDDIVAALEQDSIDWITFTSSSTVRNFFGQIDVGLLAGRKVRLASIGPITSAMIEETGLKVAVQADEYTIPGLLKAICEAENQGK